MQKNEMHPSDLFDVAVIGAGPGGYIAAIRAAQLGLKTALIEKDPTLGGTCLNVGCIPSKALLQSTELYHKLLKEGKAHGIEAEKLTLNFQQMMQRKSQVVQGLVNGVAGLIKRHKIVRFEGKGKLVLPQGIDVVNGNQSQHVQASSIIIATGSVPISLPFLPIDETTVVSSTGALSLKEIPKKLIVIGAGAIGVELASIYSRLGSEVVVVEMLDRICPTMDLAVSKMMLQILKKQGITFNLSAKVTDFKKTSDGVSLSITQDQQNSTLNGNVVLVAIGRRPYTEGLGLAEAGVQLDPKGFVKVDHRFQTNVPHVYAIGDVIEGPMLAHKGFEEGVAVAEIVAE